MGPDDSALQVFMASDLGSQSDSKSASSCFASAAVRAVANVCLEAVSSVSPGPVPKPGASKTFLADPSTLSGNTSLAQSDMLLSVKEHTYSLLCSSWQLPVPAASVPGNAMFTFPQALELGMFLQAKALPSCADFLKQLDGFLAHSPPVPRPCVR